LHVNTAILRGSRLVPAKRLAVSTAPTAYKLRHPKQTNKQTNKQTKISGV